MSCVLKRYMSSNDVMRLKMGRGPLSELDHFTSHRMIKLEHMVVKYRYHKIMTIYMEV